MAKTGRVCCWVDASKETGGGAVHRGDRLTTLHNPGHAMRVNDEARAAGTVIGKGGCSVGWLAEQEEPLPRLVALKEIKADLD